MENKTFYTRITAFDVFLSLRNQRHPFILDSSMKNDKLGRYSFVGADPFLTFSSKGSQCHIIYKDGREETLTGDPFIHLQKLLKQYSVNSHEKLPFIGGAVGYFSYDLCHFIENLPQIAVDDINTLDCFWGFYDGIYIFDHQSENIELVALGFDGSETETLIKMQTNLQQLSKQRPTVAPYHKVTPAAFQTNMTKEEYIAAISHIREYIRAGDIYQANFTQRFECEFTGDPISFYHALRSNNPAPFSAFIDTGDCVIASSSPERFISLRNGIIETRPIKGTITRGKTLEEEEKNSSALLESEKDRAELLMIVDLERNDLSRVARKGTVKVQELFKIETYATVHHLVANVTAELRAEYDLIDCIRATFPGGSITGAPKIRAMQIIDELEPTQRSVYTGSIGYLGFDGSMDLNIAIRTLIIKNNKAYLQAGGGIVWDSDPELEYQESLLKAQALMETLES